MQRRCGRGGGRGCRSGEGGWSLGTQRCVVGTGGEKGQYGERKGYQCHGLQQVGWCEMSFRGRERRSRRCRK